MPDASVEIGFVALFVASLMAATVLPGGSELVLIGVVHRHPDALWAAIAVATAGNTLGSLTSYVLGRLLPNRLQPTVQKMLQRYGYWALLLAWLPLIGDAFAVGAGWMRLNPWLSAAALAVGKLVRYAAVGGGWAWFRTLAG
jgi:membrane protein YqaA with SNARE-associated domain